VRFALTLKLVTRTSHARARWVTTLDHKVGDDAVKHQAVIKSTAGKIEETGTGHFGITRKHADLDRPLAGIHGNVDIFDVAHVPKKKPRLPQNAQIFLQRLAI
jgi:hypothetical protein